MLNVSFCLRVAISLNFVGCTRISQEAIARPSDGGCSLHSLDCLLLSLLVYVALPDIVPDVELLRDDMKMQLIPLEYLRCPLEEKCLSASADFLIRYYSWNDLIVIIWLIVWLRKLSTRVNLHCSANSKLTSDLPALDQSQGSIFLSHVINFEIILNRNQSNQLYLEVWTSRLWWGF